MGRIEAVCFDAGGTLIHMDPPPEIIFADLCRQVGITVTPEAVAAAYAQAEPWFGAHSQLYAASPEQFWLEGNRVLLETLGVRDDVEEHASHITREFASRQTDWRVYADVAETLDALRRRGLPLAVVSNWDPGLGRLLTRLGLGETFAAVIGSADAGVAKPDPRIFHLATDALGVVPERALHVGDLHDYDVVGAQAAGLIPVLLDRRGTPRASVFGADLGRPYDGLRIADLRELLPIIEGDVAHVGAAS